MARLSSQDTSFLALETPAAQMHVGLLMTCRMPRGARSDFMQQLHAHLAGSTVDAEPFNLRLVEGRRLGRYAPSWKVAGDVDLGYHLRHIAVPWPGGERELGLAVSHLHSLTLDRSRPLWEFTLIEGLLPARFALYLKVHHALGDGLGLLGQVASGFAESPRGATSPPWSAATPSRPGPKPRQAPDEDWQRFFAELLGSLGRTNAPRSAPLIPRGPRCLLNGATTRRRRVATQQLSLSRVKAVARATDATVNDVVLAVCSGALRAYLAKFDRVPRENLLASVPVALPRADGDGLGSSVATIHTSLATTLRDPRRRLLAIREATRTAKDEFRRVPPSLHRAINALGMQVAMTLPKYLNPRAARAAFTNLTISNVPGPRQPLYFGGARIEGMYPLSVLPGDQRLNVTVLSYDRRLHFGLVGCPDTLPGVQYLAVQLPVALCALEASLARARGRRGSARVAQVDR